MQFIGHLIVRLIVIFIGVLIAILAASIFLSAGLFNGFFNVFFFELNIAVDGALQDTGPMATFAIFILGFLSSFYVASIVTLPAVITIAVAELMRWQSITANLVLGGLVGLFTGMSTYARTHAGLPSDGTLIILLAAGFCGGFFYWLVAGRNAGNWLGEPQSPGD